MNTREEKKEASEKLEDIALEEEEENEGALFDPEKEKEIEDMLEEEAVKKGKVGKRVARRASGKIVGKGFRKIFK